MAVVRSGSGVGAVFGSVAITLDLTTFAVINGSSLLLAIVAISGTPGTVAVNWDATGTNVAMTQVSVSTGTGLRVYIFKLINPVAGQKTLRASGLASNNTVLGAIAFAGTDTVNGVVAGDTLTATGTTPTNPISIGPITSTTDGATVAGVVAAGTSNGLATTSQAQAYLLAGSPPGSASSYAIGGTSHTHTWSVTLTGAWAAVGVHVIASGAATSGAGGGRRHSVGGVHNLGISDGISIILSAEMGAQ